MTINVHDTKAINQASSHSPIEYFLRPRSIAIIGASTNPNSPGGRPQIILKQHDYQGELYLVNPKVEQINGQRCYSSISELPGPVDLALVAIAAPMVPEALRELVNLGVPAAYVISSGFSEAGKGTEGESIQRELEAVVAEGRIRIGGPNAEGIYNLIDDIAIGFSPTIDYERGLHRKPRKGNVAVLSHSGGLGFGIFQRGIARDIDFSHVVSTGNEIDIDYLDYLEYLVEHDAATEVIVLFLEGVSDIPRLERLALRAVELGKAIVTAKVGRTAEAQAAAISHTGHMTGPSELYSAIFRRVGITEVVDFEQLLDVVAVLSKYGSADGNRVGIVTGSGGSGAWLTDTVKPMGVAVPRLSQQTQDALMDELPYFASAVNPVDITASSSHGSDTLGNVLRTVGQSDEIDVVVLIDSMIVEARTLARLEIINKVLPQIDKPLISYNYTFPDPNASEAVSLAGIPWFQSQRGIGQAVLALAERGSDLQRLSLPEYQQQLLNSRDPEPQSDLWPAEEPVPQSIPEHRVKTWLARHGVPMPPAELVTTGQQAIDAAERIGYPVVLKAQSPLVPHKAEVGGLALGLKDAHEVEEAFARIESKLTPTISGPDWDGILVEKMADPGFELLIGASVSEALENLSFLTIARGGSYAEELADAITIPAPATESDIRQAMRGLKCWHELNDEGVESVDLAAFCELASKISTLVDSSRDRLRELDINPVLVGKPGEGVAVVDGLAKSI